MSSSVDIRRTIRFQNCFLRSNPQESFPERGSAILVFTSHFSRVTIRNLSVSWCPTQKRFIGLWRNIKIRPWLLPLHQIARDFLILVIISKLSAISYSKFFSLFFIYIIEFNDNTPILFKYGFIIKWQHIKIILSRNCIILYEAKWLVQFISRLLNII